jgi:hypothetical protein
VREWAKANLEKRREKNIMAEDTLRHFVDLVKTTATFLIKKGCAKSLKSGAGFYAVVA